MTDAQNAAALTHPTPSMLTTPQTLEADAAQMQACTYRTT